MNDRPGFDEAVEAAAKATVGEDCWQEGVEFITQVLNVAYPIINPSYVERERVYDRATPLREGWSTNYNRAAHTVDVEWDDGEKDEGYDVDQLGGVPPEVVIQRERLRDMEENCRRHPDDERMKAALEREQQVMAQMEAGTW